LIDIDIDIEKCMKYSMTRGTFYKRSLLYWSFNSSRQVFSRKRPLTIDHCCV